MQFVKFSRGIPANPPSQPAGNWHFFCPPTAELTGRALEDATSICALFEKVGLSKRLPSSRIGAAIGLMRKIDQAPSWPQAQRLQTSSEAGALLADFFQLSTIAKGIPSGDPEPHLQRKLETLLSDAREAPPNTDSSGRDTQFELFVAASLAQAGFTVTLEPELKTPNADILIQDGATRLAIEAKRAKNWNALTKRLKKATRQLPEGERTGIVAIDASRVEPQSGASAENDPLRASSAHAAATQQLTSRLCSLLGSIQYGTRAQGILSGVSVGL